MSYFKNIFLEIPRRSYFFDKGIEKGYLRRLGNKYSILEDLEGRCIFYHNGCIIYTVRPNQCRTYLFWFQNLRAEKNWRKAVQECPDIGKGRKYQKEEILELLESSFH